MTPSNIEILTLTVAKLTEPVTIGQLVGFEGAPAGVDEPVLGIAKYSADAGRPLAVVSQGLVEMKASVPIAAGDLVYPDANGNPTNVGTENPCGIAFQGGAAGDLIAVLLK